MGRVLQVPGWSNIFTQPIINRIEMLSTGVRTDIGVKVFGPTWRRSTASARTIEAALKPINGARDVVAAPIMGKGYLEIDIDREKAARYGITRRGHSERDRGRPWAAGSSRTPSRSAIVSRCAFAMPAPAARTRRAFGGC